MQVQLTLGDGSGNVCLLDPNFALDDSEVTKEVPVQVIPGRHGGVVDPKAIRIEPRVLSASATYEGTNKKDVDTIVEGLRGLLFSTDLMWLKPYSDADRFIRATCTRVSDNYHRGRFGGRLVTITAQFEAHDPFWYGLELDTKQLSLNIPAGQSIEQTISCGGSVLIDPTLWIKGPVTRPVIRNLTTGTEIKFRGTLSSSQYLIVDCFRFLAIVANTLPSGSLKKGFPNPILDVQGTNALNQIEDSYLIDGFYCTPGDNVLEFSHGGSSSATFSSAIIYRPRWY